MASQSFICHLEFENENTTNEAEGEIYGDMNEDLQSATIDNPYYGEDIELSEHPYGANSHIRNNNSTETITTTTNIYYDDNHTELSGPHTSILTATQNAYYE